MNEQPEILDADDVPVNQLIGVDNVNGELVQRKDVTDRAQIELYNEAFENLTIKERRFVNAFCEHGNATRAYKEAGYAYRTESTAGSSAHKMRYKEKIQLAIQERFKLLAMKGSATVSESEALEELSKIVWSKDSSEGAKLKALDMLLKVNGTYNNVGETKGEVVVVLGDDIVENVAITKGENSIESIALNEYGINLDGDGEAQVIDYSNKNKETERLFEKLEAEAELIRDVFSDDEEEEA